MSDVLYPTLSTNTTVPALKIYSVYTCVQVHVHELYWCSWCCPHVSCCELLMSRLIGDLHQDEDHVVSEEYLVPYHPWVYSIHVQSCTCIYMCRRTCKVMWYIHSWQKHIFITWYIHMYMYALCTHNCAGYICWTDKHSYRYSAVLRFCHVAGHHAALPRSAEVTWPSHDPSWGFPRAETL